MQATDISSEIITEKGGMYQIWEDFKSTYIVLDLNHNKDSESLKARHDRAIAANKFACKYSIPVFTMLKDIWTEYKQINSSSNGWEQLYHDLQSIYDTQDNKESLGQNPMANSISLEPRDKYTKIVESYKQYLYHISSKSQ